MQGRREINTGFILQGGLKDSEYVSVQGNVTRLGTKKYIAPRNEYQNGDFIFHQDGPKSIPHNDVGNQFSTVHTLKRPVTAIESYKTEEQLRYLEDKGRRKDSESRLRTEQSILRSQRSGFNVITGELMGTGPKVVNPHMRYIGNGLGEESQRKGLQTMQDSSNRYFTPQFSGEYQHNRQKRLVTDGLSRPKMAGVIKTGTAEAPSNGIEDQFSRSDYMPRAKPLAGQ
jgi:hypothetical protein